MRYLKIPVIILMTICLKYILMILSALNILLSGQLSASCTHIEKNHKKKQDAALSHGGPRDAAAQCTFRYVSNFTTASCGFSATARISCWSLSADCTHCSKLSIKKCQVLETTSQIA